MIQLIDIYKDYPNGHRALKGVNIEVGKGEFIFVVGASGAGKSTFIKLLLKEENPTSGQIILDEEDITRVKQREIAHIRRKVGVVFQDFRLLPNKTVYENIAFAMEIIEENPKNIKRQVPMVLGLVGLSEKANSYPHQLSGGEQQRVALARAIINNPKLLICDEPTGNLDPDTAQGIMDAIYEINYRGTTVIMATHAKDIVNRAKKRVVVLKNGEIVSDQQQGRYDSED